MTDEAELTGASPRRRPKQDILEIGGRRLSPETLMMGHGFDPALSEGSLKPPIFLTSTFVFENHVNEFDAMLKLYLSEPSFHC